MKPVALCFRTFLLLLGLYLPTTAFADLTRIEQDHPSVTYQGSWQTLRGPRVSGGSVAYATAAGARATITFTGTGITWVGYQCECAGGAARVYLDGRMQHTHPGYRSTVDILPKTGVYSVSGLANGTHTLTIEVTGPSLDGNFGVVIDAFHVETGAITELLEENSTSITYTGAWTDIDDPNVSGGSVVASREAGATATVRFRGTGISWIGVRCDCAAGVPRVTLDGASVVMSPLNSPTREHQVIVMRAHGLSAGDHVLRIAVTGNSTGTTPWIVVDAFRVQTGTTDGPDTRPPEIAILSPVAGSTVAGYVDIMVDVFDNVSVITERRFYVDGVQIQLRPGNPLWNMWDTYASGDGSHVLTVVARDAAGNETRSAPVTVTVRNGTADTRAPTVTMTAPQSDASVTGVVTLSATATDDTGVTRVAFYTSTGILIGEDSTAPYSITRDTRNIPSGTRYALEARAWDAAGNVGMSTLVPVVVQH